MRFIHTSDWHLGRLFHGVHLTGDQAHLLDQLVDLARETKVEAVLIAGDVFDRAVPPPEAVELLDDVLGRLVLGLKIPVIMIAGNHDSPVRLGFGARVLAESGLYVRGALSSSREAVVLEDDSGPILVHTLPYAEPAAVRECLSLPEVLDHHGAMAARILDLAGRAPSGSRSIVVTHAFVAGATTSESERPLCVGGSGTVEAGLFRDFDFVALGHLHRPQNIGDIRLHYSGSLFKYSFSEAGDRKSVSLVDLGPAGEVRVERIALTPRRDLRQVKGFLKDLLQGPGPGESREDYLKAILLDEGAILDAMGRLREIYPNLLHIERPFVSVGTIEGSGPMDHRRQKDADLFAAFFEQVTGQAMNTEQTLALSAIIDNFHQQERES